MTEIFTDNSGNTYLLGISYPANTTLNPGITGSVLQIFSGLCSGITYELILTAFNGLGYSGYAGPLSIYIPFPNLFFSENAEFIGKFDNTTNNLSLYSATYSPSINVTFQKNVTLPSVFSGLTTQNCLISSDGEYVITSVPEEQEVHFIKTSTNTILQTITEDINGFGSMIAADKEFLGLVIGTKQLNRNPSIYDTKMVSYSASSKMCYYKRNYSSSNTQKFKKIHTNHAQMAFKKTGLDGKSYLLSDPFYVGAIFGLLQKESSAIVDVGVFRYDDLQCKNFNFASSILALKQDQIDYKSCFINIDSPRPLSATLAGFTLNQVTSIQANVVYQYDPLITGTLPTDALLGENLKLTTLPGVNQFSIIKHIGTGYYEDKSYLSTVPTPPVIQFSNVPEFGFDNPGGITFFEQNIDGSFAEKSFIRGTFRLLIQGNEALGATNNLTPIIDEQVINTKIGINDTHTYHVSKVLTGVTGDFIKNIRIYRTHNTSENNITTFSFQDWNKNSQNTLAQPSPGITGIGLIKIMYNSLQGTTLESTFLNRSTMNNNLKWRVGITAKKPYLTDPTNYPNSEFAYTVSQTILDDTLNSIFVSNNFMFINFTNSTMLFSINNSLSYKPLIFVKTFTESLKNYKFTYNPNGEFFFKENKIYKYDSSTQNLIFIGQL